MPLKEKGRRSDRIPKAILCQDVSESTSQLLKLQIFGLASRFAINAARAPTMAALFRGVPS
jgi:hypothetical protein